MALVVEIVMAVLATEGCRRRVGGARWLFRQMRDFQTQQGLF